MRFLSLALLVLVSPVLSASGLLLPNDKGYSPLSMVSHRVEATIDDQVGVTTVEQVFRNHSNVAMEATYLFPVPKGASINKFSLWIDGKETAGELIEAKKATQIYIDIVRRMKDPAILEYVGQDLLKMRVFPVPARGDARVKLRFTAVAPKDAGLIEYTYPMRTDGRANRTLDEFSLKITLKSQHAISTIYSPTHSVSVIRTGSHEANVEFDKKQSLLDRDFQLFYAVSDREIGLTPILYKPLTSEDGYFMFLISPEMEAAKHTRVPRDLVMVLDTSGSMSDVKLAQARKALKHFLSNLNKNDRFALINFATVVSTFKDELLENNAENLEHAHKWVDDLRQSGGTAILPALNRALDFRPRGEGRPFTIVFFTDGMPTVDETDPAKIVRAVASKNTANTRIFTFGVGDDVNAAMLDQLADSTKAASTYVRPSEDIEVKVSALHDKINRPVLTNVRITSTNVRLHDMYPPAIGDLFYGSQLVVLGRYAGQGPAAIKLTGEVGNDRKEFVYELNFPPRADNGKDFVEHLWARRKVGFILDQIRMNGEQKELVEEATKLAKKYGIATPYTSWLVVPDAPMPVAAPGRSVNPPMLRGGFGGNGAPAPSAPAAVIAGQAAANAPGSGGVASARGVAQDKRLDDELKAMKPEERKGAYAEALEKAKKDNQDQAAAGRNYAGGKLSGNQTGTLGVDLALASNALRNQERLTISANRAVQGRNCVEIGGVWIDDKFDSKMPLLAIKAQSDAYFRLLELKPEMREVYVLGNHIVWVAPNGTAVVIDTKEGKESVEDADLTKLFVGK